MNLTVNAMGKPLTPNVSIQFNGKSNSELDNLKKHLQQVGQAPQDQFFGDKKELVKTFYNTDFGNGISGKEILIAIYVAYAEQNAVAKKVFSRKEFTVKLNKHLLKQFHPSQKVAILKALSSISSAYKDIERTCYRKNFILKVSVREPEYESFFKVSFDKMEVSIETLSLIQEILQENSLLKKEDKVDFRFDENYPS